MRKERKRRAPERVYKEERRARKVPPVSSASEEMISSYTGDLMEKLAWGGLEEDEK